MNKEKLDQIKKKIKFYAPTVIAFTAAATAVVLTAKSIKTSIDHRFEDLPGSPFEPLPVITGEEKEKLLAREDSILQKLEDDIYFYSFPPTED